MIQYEVPMVYQERSMNVRNTCWFASLLMLLQYHKVDKFGPEDNAGAGEKVGPTTRDFRTMNSPISLSEFYRVRAEVNPAIDGKLKYVKLADYSTLDGTMLQKLLTDHGPIVCGGLFAVNFNIGNDFNTGHYVVMSGHDDEGNVHYNDPIAGQRELPFLEFKSLLFSNSINFKRAPKDMRVSIHESRYNFMYWKK